MTYQLHINIFERACVPDSSVITVVHVTQTIVPRGYPLQVQVEKKINEVSTEGFMDLFTYKFTSTLDADATS